MGNFISFKPQDTTLPTRVRLIATNTFFENLNKPKAEAVAILCRLSASHVLLATKSEKGDSFKLLTPDGGFVCAPNEKGDLLIKTFHKNDLIAQSKAMRYGVCFHAPKGVIINTSYKKNKREQICYDIANGETSHANTFDAEDCSASTKMLLERMALARVEPEDEVPGEEEPYQPGTELAELLHLADSYSLLTSQLEETKAMTRGRIAYSGIESLRYDRIDRHAYRFSVDELDETVFKVGILVEITDLHNERHTAEILSLVKEDPEAPATAVDLLFRRQISIRSLPAQGWISLPFSTVNRDVQVAAMEKISSGEAKAKYMDAVLGRKEPAGFENNDLSALMARLDAEKPPFNSSQKAAIAAGINSKDVFLVMGPPGTGKTTVIREWVRYFVTQKDKRVLVSSQNNMAVDNVLTKFLHEEDIDVLRIGSEAKVQTDVHPFLFEKKVSNLRESISGASGSNCHVIDRIADQWTAFAGQLQQVTQTLERKDAYHTQLVNAAQDTIRPLYNELLQFKRKYQDQQREKQQFVDRINELAPKLRKHEKSSNFVSEFFTGFGYKNNLSAMRQLIYHMDLTRRGMDATADQYRQCKERFDAACARIRDELYLPYERTSAALEELFRTLPEKPARPAEDIWDLFSKSRRFPLKSPDDCAGLHRQLMLELKKAMELKEMLSQWHTDMGSMQNYALNDIVLASVNLVGATCIGINSQRRFADLDFDVTIIDEAGQIQIHNALVPMSVSNKLIMVGDHQQIPPSADQDLLDLCEENEVESNLLEKSLFEEMYNTLPDSNKIMLDTQYRMPGEIADTISRQFYGGKYYSPPAKRGQKSLIPALSGKPYVVIDTSAVPDRHETKLDEGGYYNELEASVVADLIRHLSADPEYDLKQIGVISAYTSQVHLIRKKISRFLTGELANEMVASLDSFQGQERDIIIYSFTRSSNISPRVSRIGFLWELRRLNVAMTRGKKMLVLVGDMQFLGSCQYLDKDEDGKLSEKRNELKFSNFINKMLADVRSGQGELITYRQFRERMKGADDT